MRILSSICCLLLLCLASCATKEPVMKPVPAAIVQVSDTKPLVQAVERQTARLESRVTDTARRVATIDDAVSKAVEDAIRAGDVAREAEARRFQAQVRELRTLTESASQTAKDLQEDSAATHKELAKVADERDAAVMEREQIRTTMLSDRVVAGATLSRMDEKRIAEETRANEWRKKALVTWGIIGSIGAIIVGLKVGKYI